MAHETPESTESTPGEAESTPATSDKIDTSSTETTATEEVMPDSAARKGDAEAVHEEQGDDGDGDGEADDGESEADGGEADESAESSEESSAEGSSEASGEKKKRKRKRKKKANPEVAQRATDRAPFHVGEEVFGKVTAVVEAAIMVDLSGKALAIFDRSEMEADDLLPEVGERFVGRVLNDGGRGGLVVLTRKPLREEEEKPKIEQAHKEGSLVSGLITGVIKGGVEVLVGGVRAFAPASGVDLHPRAANLAQLVGKRLDFKVTSYEKQGRDVVVTRRPMIEKEAHERRKAAREALVEGAEMAGVVRTVVDWGVFVALPEAEFLEGLVHASEVSHNPREKLADALKPGQKIRVKVLKVDEKGKVWLSRKALLEDPFAKVFENVQIGQVVQGEITRVEEFGAFVKIADGVEGLIHVSDLGVVRVDDARSVLKAGESLNVLVHHFDERQRRIGLHPAPTEAQLAETKQKVVKNNKIDVEVAKVESAGLQVRILGATGRHARGFIPAGQTATPRGSELRSHFTVGQKLSVLVVDIDPKNREPKLSVSKLAQDEERRAHKEYRDKLKAEASFGTLGDLLKRKIGG